MGYYSEKIAYLRGLIDGLDLKNDSKEGKLLNAVIEAMGDMADEIDDLSSTQQEMQARIDELDSELCDFEDEFYSIDGDDLDEDGDYWDDEEEEYAFECPKCGEPIYLDVDMLESDDNAIVCPNCHEKIELEFDSDCGIDCDSCGGCEDRDE